MRRAPWSVALCTLLLAGCGSDETQPDSSKSDAAAGATSHDPDASTSHPAGGNPTTVRLDAGHDEAGVPDAGAMLKAPLAGEPMPTSLGELGLFPDVRRLDSPAQGVWTYEPRWPLWSNGSVKFRGVAVPGEALSVKPDPNSLQPGTLFFKTFAFVGDQSGQLKPIETRIIRLADPVEYYRYRWNDAGDDAVLIEDVQAIGVEVTNSDGATLVHQIPSERDCKSCHEASEAPILGYREIQLQDTPLDFDDEQTAQIAGYFYGNCSHCHNGRESDLAAFDLRPEVFMQNTINHPMEDTDAIGTRIVPGDAQSSLLWVALNGGDEDEFVDRMPLVGVQLIDQVAVEDVAAWIEQLADESYCDADCPDCEGCAQ